MYNYIKKVPLIKKYLFITIILHFVSAYFSQGFYKDDEHFQILEPIAYLLNFNNIILNDNGYWYWEWEYAMRPWTQSYLYYVLIKLAQFFNINNPFIWAFIIKFFSSAVGLISIFYLFQTFKKNFNFKETHFNYLLFFSFWFYPFIHSRTSSENLGISIFIISFCFLYKSIIENNKKYNLLSDFFFGLLIGLSLVIRLNLLFTIVPIFLWVLFFKFNFKKIVIVSLGVLIALIIGIIIDSINYKYFAITYWNFFYWNIIWGRMADFGHQPWWFYFSSILIELAPFLSIFFVFGLIFYWLKNPLSVFTFFTILTIIIISIFSHKETRYVFPVYIFAPFFIIYFFDYFKNYSWVFFAKYIVIISNSLFLLLTLFTPANGKIALLNFLHKKDIDQQQIFYLDNNPYLINEMEPFFYTHTLPKIKKFEKEINKTNFNKSWFVTNNYEKYKLITKIENCTKKYNSFPEYIINLNSNWKNLKFNWYVVYCD